MLHTQLCVHHDAVVIVIWVIWSKCASKRTKMRVMENPEAFIVAVFKKGKKHIHVSSKFQLSPCVADNQRLKPSASISHQKPVYPGIQERHSLPASNNTSSLDLLKMYIFLTGDVGEFVVIMPRSFTQDKVQSPKKVYTLKMEEFICFCFFTSHVNSYGHCGMVSSLNHTFSWAGLSKRLTSNLCTYFRL